MALEMPFRKSNVDQKSITLMGPSVWNKLRNHLKIPNTATSFIIVKGNRNNRKPSMINENQRFKMGTLLKSLKNIY